MKAIKPIKLIKIKTLAQVAEISTQIKKAGKKAGLITGCFDVVHAGHVDLFRFAKKHCDLVIVGLDSDETIRINKGPNRPIHNIFQRKKVLAEFESVDLVFEIVEKMNWATKEAENIYEQIYVKIKPNYLITNPVADKFWQLKESRAKINGAKLLKDIQKKDTSTTQIIEKIAAEN